MTTGNVCATLTLGISPMSVCVLARECGDLVELYKHYMFILKILLNHTASS